MLAQYNRLGRVSFCEGAESTFVLFYERKPGSKRKQGEHAGQETKIETAKFGYMTRYCSGIRDVDAFLPIPEAMRQPGRCVTGLVNAGACGFVFDSLNKVEPELSFNPTEWRSVFKKGAQAGAWCAVRDVIPAQIEAKTWYIVAVARVCKPYAVWFQGEYGSIGVH